LGQLNKKFSRLDEIHTRTGWRCTWITARFIRAGPLKSTSGNRIWYGSNTLPIHRTERSVTFTCSRQSKKNRKIFRWSTKKICLIGYRTFWTAFPAKNWIRSLEPGSTGSWL
jgi:hypothetical protein